MAENMSFPAEQLVGSGFVPLKPALPFNAEEPYVYKGELEANVAEATDVTAVDGVATLDSTDKMHGEHSRVRRWARAAKEIGQAAVAVAVLSPLNEIVRGAAFAAGYSVSRDPAMGAFTLGASTLLVEGAGAMAAASLLGTEKARPFNAALEKRLEKVGDTKLSQLTKVTTALTLGSVAGMALEQAEDPGRTVEQNRKYGLVTSAWLAGTLAVGGALGSEAVTSTIENPAVMGPLAGTVTLMEVARRKWRNMRYPDKVENPMTEEWRDSDKRYTYHLVKDPTELRHAAKIEQDVWDEKGFGKLDEAGYTEHIRHSRTFAAFDKDGECIGVNRMFGAYEDVVPPFLELPFDSEDERVTLSQRAREGKLEELGTVAVVKDARGQGVNGRLWRLAYRDAVARGVEEWGIIMEPERVAKLNKYHGFTFRQLGSPEDYQGGDCAAFVMNLEEAASNVQKKHPLQHFGLVRARLKP